MRRVLFLGLAVPLTLALTACGSWPTDNDSDTSTAELGTEPPGEGFERLQRITGYAYGDCEGPQADDRLAAARDDLRQRASESGADYIRVVGTGALDQRGRCSDEVYRITGVAYARAGSGDAETSSEQTDKADAEQQQQTPESPTAAEPEQRSTADKLAELEELRQRGLISESEYKRLRRNVLDEAF